MLSVKVNVADGIEQEQFESAMNCALTCIRSVLYPNSEIELEGNTITVKNSNLIIAQLKEKIAGCFCDDGGNLYPEFSKINLD